MGVKNDKTNISVMLHSGISEFDSSWNEEPAKKHFRFNILSINQMRRILKPSYLEIKAAQVACDSIDRYKFKPETHTHSVLHPHAHMVSSKPAFAVPNFGKFELLITFCVCVCVCGCVSRVQCSSGDI